MRKKSNSWIASCAQWLTVILPSSVPLPLRSEPVNARVESKKEGLRQWACNRQDSTAHSTILEMLELRSDFLSLCSNATQFHCARIKQEIHKLRHYLNYTRLHTVFTYFPAIIWRIAISSQVSLRKSFHTAPGKMLFQTADQTDNLKSLQRAGKKWQHACLAYLREEDAGKLVVPYK